MTQKQERILHVSTASMNGRKLTQKHALQPHLQTHFMGQHVFFKSVMAKTELPINKYPQLNL